MRIIHLLRAIIVSAAFFLAGPVGATIVWEYTGTANAGGIPGLSAGDPFSVTVTLDETVPDSDPDTNIGIYSGAVQNVVFDFGAGTGSFAGAPPGANRVAVGLPGVAFVEVLIGGVVPLAGQAAVDVRIILTDPLNTLGTGQQQH